ncbi:MAG TPA: hypothetical protein VKA63_02650 [Candidatus Krumholzibacteria bacterium]|nr:hypothetical protein [Candidatus Krumholzibacteria bacterium]
MTNLIQDINAGHSARSATASGCLLIAQLLLKRFSKEEIFAQAETWAYSEEVREDIRFNGAVGTVTLKTALETARTFRPETPEEKAERFRRLDQEDATNVARGLTSFAEAVKQSID